MVPGALTMLSPSRWASPERGCTNPAYPSGMATATPVPTSARWKGASSTSSATDRSAPASPGSAYRGGTASVEVSRTGTSSSGISGTSATLAAPRPQIRQHPLGQGLGRAAVAVTRDRRTDHERRRLRDRPRERARDPALHGPEPDRAEQCAEADRGAAVDRALLRPARQVRGTPGAGVTAGGAAVQLVQLADEDQLDPGDEQGLRAELQ